MRWWWVTLACVGAEASLSVVFPFDMARFDDVALVAATLREHLRVADFDAFYAVSPCHSQEAVAALQSCTPPPSSTRSRTPLDAATATLLKRSRWRLDVAFPESCAAEAFAFVPEFRHVCEDLAVCGKPPCRYFEDPAATYRPSGWHVQQLVTLGVSAMLDTDFVLFLDADALAVGEISRSTLTVQAATRLLSWNCKVDDPRWLSDWEFWKTEYLTAIKLLSHDDFRQDFDLGARRRRQRPQDDDDEEEAENNNNGLEQSFYKDSEQQQPMCVATTSPTVASVGILRDVVERLDYERDRRWYQKLINVETFTDMTLYNAHRLLYWDAGGAAAHVADNRTRILELWPPRGELNVSRTVAHQHAQYVLAKWKVSGQLRDAMFLNCHSQDTKLTASECYELSRLVADASKDELFGGNDDDDPRKHLPGRRAANDGGGDPYAEEDSSTTTAQLLQRQRAAEKHMYKDLRGVLTREAKCPERLGIALNTGDQSHAMNRVRYSLSRDGWIGDPDGFLKDYHKKTVNPPVVVYSSVADGCLPFGNAVYKDDSSEEENATVCVPMRPCCGGKNLGSNLADAQQMREHTWKRMLQDFPKDTYWFLSTEDDVWWDVDGLCDLTAEVVADFGVPPSTPMLIGGGAPVESAVYGGLVLMNRPLLELYANDTLLNECREDLVKQGNTNFKNYTYHGAKYNNDHLISHCAFEFFPNVLHVYVARRIYFPIFFAHAPRPEFFYHNGGSWAESTRAWDFVTKLHDDEPILAFHHAKISDMAFLQDSLRLLRHRRRRD